MPTPDYSAWPTLDDVEIVLAAAQITPSNPVRARFDALSAAIQTEVARETRRQFVPVQEDRLFDGSGTPVLDVDEIVTLDGIALLGGQSEVLGAITAYLVSEAGQPQMQISTARGGNPAFANCFPSGRRNIKVSATWGYAATIPADLWDGVTGRIAASMARLTFATAGRADGRGLQIVEEQFGDERKKYAKFDHSESFIGPTEWKALLKRYKRPSRAASSLRGGMIG